MANQMIFMRYELKYLLDERQKRAVMDAMRLHMAPDRYSRSTIRNIYFDTDNYRLIRNSIEKPAYKEKLRIRSYTQAEPDSNVFVELKKKYRKVVYKRRVELSEESAMDWVQGRRHPDKENQITHEIDYFLNYYKTLSPAVFLSYEREAYCSPELAGFRVTFDRNILCRQKDISLESEIYGAPLLPEGYTLMEIKCGGGIPLWMTQVLSKGKIYKASFSKYGTAYRELIYPETRREVASDDRYVIPRAI